MSTALKRTKENEIFAVVFQLKQLKNQLCFDLAFKVNFVVIIHSNNGLINNEKKSETISEILI